MESQYSPQILQRSVEELKNNSFLEIPLKPEVKEIIDSVYGV